LETTIPESLAILCPPNIQPRVSDVAGKLSISHAIRIGESTIEALVQLESKKLSLDKARMSKKQAAASEAQTEPGKLDTRDQLKVAGAEDALVTLRNALANRLWERRIDCMAAVVSNAREALLNSENVHATSVRGILTALELGAVPLLQCCLKENSRDSRILWGVAKDFLGVMTLLLSESEAFSHEVFKTKVASYFSDEGPLDTLIELSLKNSGDARDQEKITGLLHDVVRVKLIPSAKLEVALIRALHSHDNGLILCQHFLSHADELSNGSNDESEKHLEAFDRLQHELSLNGTLNTEDTN
jgi:hypothetical protein